jgi:Pyruvate-formate lyase-activating enzyme
MKTATLIGINRHRLTIDGEGVTTLVAFHGCPLRCKYCLNSQCLRTDGKWKRFSCQELYKEVKQDELYFLATMGGVTFGGGEPCLQSTFIRDFRELCGSQWQIAVETSLNVPLKHLEELLPVVNQYYVDIKDMDKERYYKYTGQKNDHVIANLNWLIEQGKRDNITVRVPVIPSYNTIQDTEESIKQLKMMGLFRFDQFTYLT